ncbi:MAG: hydroxymethylbilane synthase [Oscillospiraceae bacterium]|nr:hydroxymethylbilane synthase [Oscillospiraceae bacterium]
MKLRIGSRASRLAVAQAQQVMAAIHAIDPTLELELVTMTTTGDQVLDKTLDQIGGKGLFVKELDNALLQREIDIAVHSLKDMPMEQHPLLPLAAFSAREDARDVMVLRPGLEKFPLKGGIIGTASNRRAVQIKEFYPTAEIRPIRGNLQTRLEKLDRGEYDGLLLAAAGLKRLGLEGRVSRYFNTDQLIPAAGQGILGIQCRMDADLPWIGQLNDPAAAACATAERAFVRALDGGCSSPSCAHATMKPNGILSMVGLYVDEKGEQKRAAIAGRSVRAAQLGENLANRLAGK